MPLDTIQSENGVAATVAKLKEHHAPQLLHPDGPGLQRAGRTLPDVVKGYVIFREAGLNNTQQD